MNKILPIKNEPVIDIFSGVYATVAVQQLNPNYTPLIIANHFLITYHNDIESPGFNWSDYNNIGSHYIDIRDNIKDRGLITTLKEIIDRENYIQIVLDQYYINGSDEYHKRHLLHDKALIYGYDDIKEIFYVSDNFIYGRIITLEVPYNELIESRKDIEEHDAKEVYFDKEIDFDLTTDYMIRLLKTYLTNENHLHKGAIKKEDGVSYGVALYSRLNDLIKKVEMDMDYEDVRVFYIFINHYAIGKMLCKFMNEKYNNMFDTQSWENDYDKLYHMSRTLCRLYLKLLHTKSEKVAQKMYCYINEMRDLEVHIMKDMLSTLSNK